MRRKLLKVGLVLFPLTSLFCFIGAILIQALNEGSERPFEKALQYSRLYLAGGLLSVLAFIVCLVALIKTKKQSRP